MYEIKKADSIPSFSRGRKKYPFNKMAVNDYFELTKEEYQKVSSAASQFGRRNNLSFTVRSIEGKCFCYRIA